MWGEMTECNRIASTIIKIVAALKPRGVDIDHCLFWKYTLLLWLNKTSVFKLQKIYFPYIWNMECLPFTDI